LVRDTRISGPSLEKAFLEGVLTTGCHVHSYGIIPTAVLSFITRKMGMKAAAYISASYNPPEYNGVRFNNFAIDLDAFYQHIEKHSHSKGTSVEREVNLSCNCSKFSPSNLLVVIANAKNLIMPRAGCLTNESDFLY